MKQHNLKLLETFVGAGGSHWGFKEKGFKTVYAIDNDPDMITAFNLNNPELDKSVSVCKNIREVSLQEIYRVTGLKKGELDVMFGGIVCCGFSLAGVRDPSDERNTLYKEQLRLVKGLMPKISIIENVPAMKNFLILQNGANENLKKRVQYIHQKIEDFMGIKAERRKKGLDLNEDEKKEYLDIREERKKLAKIVKIHSVNVIDDIFNKYREMGYQPFARNLNSAWYGAATARTRLIIVAVRNDLGVKFNFPKITHWNKGGNRVDIFKENKNNGIPCEMLEEKLEKFVTVREALKQLDLSMINNSKNDRENIPMNHAKNSIERFSYIPQGKNIVDVLDKVPEHLRISRFYSRGCTMRLDPDKPSPTLVPGHSNFPVHPFDNRSITVREAAVITGFPVDYKFHGNHTKRCLQVGNAVPPSLSRAVAREVKKTLRNYYNECNNF